MPRCSAKPPFLAQPFVPAHVWLVLRCGSPAPPCSLLPVLRRHGRPPGTTVSRAMRRGPPPRRALLSRRVECRRVHAHAPAQGRRLQRDAALLGAGVCEPSARPQLRDHSRPLELCAPSVEPGGQPRGQGEGSEGPGACHPAATRGRAAPCSQASCSSSRASWRRRSTARRLVGLRDRLRVRVPKPHPKPKPKPKPKPSPSLNQAVSADGKSVLARLGKTRLHGAGALAYINDSVGLHKVANTSGSRAVSLHVYAPGWQRPPFYEEIVPEVDAGGAEIDACAWGDF